MVCALSDTSSITEVGQHLLDGVPPHLLVLEKKDLGGWVQKIEVLGVLFRHRKEREVWVSGNILQVSFKEFSGIVKLIDI